MTQVDFNNLEARTKPRDKAWENWSKFEKVGDSYQGYIRDVFFKKGTNNQFPDQRVLTLEQPDGVFVNVGIKHIDFVLEKTNDLRLGDPVKIVFAKQLQPQVKGHSPTKQFEFYGMNLAENASNPTVLELEIADRKIVEAVASTTVDPNTGASAGARGDLPAAAPMNAAGDLPFESTPNPVQPTGTATGLAAASAPSAPAAAPQPPVAPTAPQA